MQQINLLNVDLQKGGKDFSLFNMVQGLVVVLLCAILFYAYSAYQMSEMKQQLEDANKKLATEQARLVEITAEFLRQRSGLTLEQELKKIEAEVAAQREIITTMKSGVIGNTKGYSEYMQAFARQTLSGLWLTGFRIEGDAKQMNISGAALSPELVPGYIIRLNNEKAMRGKTFTSLQIQLPKVDAAKPVTTQYLEFTLQSVKANEADK